MSYVFYRSVKIGLFNCLYRYLFELCHEVEQMILVAVAFELHLHRHGIKMSGRSIFALHLVGVDDNFLLTQPLEQLLDRGLFRRTEGYSDVACAEVSEDKIECLQTKKHEDGRSDGQYVHACASGHADG